MIKNGMTGSGTNGPFGNFTTFDSDIVSLGHDTSDFQSCKPDYADLRFMEISKEAGYEYTIETT